MGCTKREYAVIECSFDPENENNEENADRVLDGYAGDGYRVIAACAIGDRVVYTMELETVTPDDRVTELVKKWRALEEDHRASIYLEVESGTYLDENADVIELLKLLARTP